MKFIDLPHYVRKERYVDALDRMVNHLSGKQGILSIYQIGHVSTPGISDIDLVAVFSDGASCLEDLRTELSSQDRYLFIHNLYGVSRTDFRDVQRYSFFHNYAHLWGEDVLREHGTHRVNEEVALKCQIALEYMVRMYISATIDQVYGIVKLRSFLLQVKALLYDCDFLGVSSGPLYEAIKTLVGRREKWFTVEPQFDEISRECGVFYTELKHFLNDRLRSCSLFLPSAPPYLIARNVRLVTGVDVGCRHSGIQLPSNFSFFGRRYYNLQHRLNRFEFRMPLESERIPPAIQEQFDWQKRMQQRNRKFLPHFMALSSNLNA